MFFDQYNVQPGFLSIRRVQPILLNRSSPPPSRRSRGRRPGDRSHWSGLAGCDPRSRRGRRESRFHQSGPAGGIRRPHRSHRFCRVHRGHSATEELITAAGPAESSAPEAPVSFIRESWLQPPVWIPATESKTRATGTRPLPMAFGQESGRTDGWPRRTVMAVGTVLVGLIAILAFVSVHNGQVAAKWQQRDAAQVALTQQVSAQLDKANQHITTLDGTVGSLQGQLATATSKQKGNFGSQRRPSSTDMAIWVAANVTVTKAPDCGR